MVQGGLTDREGGACTFDGVVQVFGFPQSIVQGLKECRPHGRNVAVRKKARVRPNGRRRAACHLLQKKLRSKPRPFEYVGRAQSHRGVREVRRLHSAGRAAAATKAHQIRSQRVTSAPCRPVRKINTDPTSLQTIFDRGHGLVHDEQEPPVVTGLAENEPVHANVQPLMRRPRRSTQCPTMTDPSVRLLHYRPRDGRVGRSQGIACPSVNGDGMCQGPVWLCYN